MLKMIYFDERAKDTILIPWKQISEFFSLRTCDSHYSELISFNIQILVFYPSCSKCFPTFFVHRFIAFDFTQHITNKFLVE